jgi:ABC-type multidrug transport system ATPase subunit
VGKEEDRVVRGDDAVRAVHLRKALKGNKDAVTDMTFGCGTGECVGLLGTSLMLSGQKCLVQDTSTFAHVMTGVAGSGKSATLSMLWGQVAPTSGRAVVLGCDATTQWDQVCTDVGVCVQSNSPLPKDLTGSL